MSNKHKDTTRLTKTRRKLRRKAAAKVGHWLRNYRHKLEGSIHTWAKSHRSGGKRRVNVIVRFHGKSKYGDQFAAFAKKVGVQLRKRPVPLRLIRSVAVRLSREELRKVCRCEHVKTICPDRIKRTLLNVAVPAIGSAAAARSGRTGKGVTIAVLDTGVYPHPDLTKPRNRIVAFKDFISGRRKPYDDNGHGTHCAGDAAGNGFMSKGKYRGAAPEASIVGVKVLNSNGVGRDSIIIRGIEWCVRNRRRYGIRILSISIGAPAKVPCAEDPLCQAVQRAVRRGLVVVTAAGNSGPAPGSINTPGTSPLALTVGASNDHGSVRPKGETIAPFSGRGPARGGIAKPDLVAPGVGIISLRAPGSLLDRMLPVQRVGRGYFTLSGTSMSTPIAAGSAAQVLQRYPRLTPGGLKQMLTRHAFNLRRDRNAQGRGLLNVRFLR